MRERVSEKERECVIEKEGKRESERDRAMDLLDLSTQTFKIQ